MRYGVATAGTGSGENTLSPQHATAPSASAAHAWEIFAAMSMTPLRSATGVGVGRLLSKVEPPPAAHAAVAGHRARSIRVAIDADRVPHTIHERGRAKRVRIELPVSPAGDAAVDID